jgi:hypothetical protein
MGLGSEDYGCEFPDDFDDRDDFERDAFEVDTGGEMDAPLAQMGFFVVVGKLSPKARMYVRLFAAGPPMNCEPMLN